MKDTGTIGVWGIIFLVLAVLAGCSGGDSGGGTTTAPIAGTVVKGPVSNATVFADRTGSGVRFQKDADEVSTTTDSSGNFVLSSLPANYGDYVIVSQGGTDTLSGLPGIQMVAPAGMTRVTPLTTLVAMDTTGTVGAKIESLGVARDANISQNATTAALLLAKSVETVIQVLNRSFADGGASTLVLQELQAAFMKAITQEIAKTGTTTATLTNPVSLEALLTAALNTALGNINTTYGILHVNNINAFAQSVASTVNGVATALGPISTSGAVSEASALSSTALANISNAITTQVTNNNGNVAVGADVIFPMVTSTFPADGAVSVSSKTITATFSEAMDPATITTGTLIVSNGAIGTILYDQGTLTATFTANTLNYSTAYTVTISGAKDLVGNAVDNKTWTFTTMQPTGSTGGSGGTGF